MIINHQRSQLIMQKFHRWIDVAIGATRVAMIKAPKIPCHVWHSIFRFEFWERFEYLKHLCVCFSAGWLAAPGPCCLWEEATAWSSMTTNQDRPPEPSQRSGQPRLSDKVSCYLFTNLILQPSSDFCIRHSAWVQGVSLSERAVVRSGSCWSAVVEA